MLIHCPECELQVSDKAISCPHCGYPLKQPRNITHQPRRMRLPNGFGQISELKGRHLRKPFRAMVTTGINPDTGRPICKLLKPTAYFKTYNEAYAALVEYNKNPYELDQYISLQELYDKWMDVKEKLISASGKRMYTAAWKYCTTVYSVCVRELKISHIKYCMEEGVANGHTASAETKRNIKSLFNVLLDYAVENGITDKNIARQYVTHAKRETSKHHMPYSEDEIAKLWANISLYGVDLILIQCYTGLRPQELGLIETDSYSDGIVRGGIKTEAGKNRVIPVHSRIAHLVRAEYNKAVELGSKYLFNHTQSKDGRKLSHTRLTYERYKDLYESIVKELGLNPEHKAHDGRAHFATMAKKYNMDEYAIKRIMGHSIKDLTERVYTTRDIAWLREEMEKIKG